MAVVVGIVICVIVLIVVLAADALAIAFHDPSKWYAKNVV
jgi:hypothetical protein